MAARYFADSGFCLTLGLVIGLDEAENVAEIEAAVDIVNSHPANVRRIIVGNETQTPASGAVPLGNLIALIRNVRTATAGRISISAAETILVWGNSEGAVNRDLIDAVDEITIHIYGYFDGIPAVDAVDYAYRGVDAIRGDLARIGIVRPIVIGECGFPAYGEVIGKSVPGSDAQRLFVKTLLARANERSEDIFYFEVFSEPYMRYRILGSQTSDAAGEFGIFLPDRRIRDQLRDLFPAVPEPAAESRWYRVFTRGAFAPGYELFIDGDKHGHGWVALDGGAIALDYPEGECYGVALIEQPRFPYPLGGYSHLVIRATGVPGSKFLLLNVDAQTNGRRLVVEVSGVSGVPSVVAVPLGFFGRDLANLFANPVFMFVGPDASSVRVEDIYYIPSDQVSPDSPLTYRTFGLPW
jgi:exo-beta-1,3-glucanase (GH17 family)